jgi:ABC-2 type transport system permease protein
LLGSALRKTEAVSGVSISLSFYLFFLAGGITDIAYLPRWLQDIATYIPNSYALDALRGTLLYNSSTGILMDIGVLALAGIVALVIGIPVMRRGLSH